MADARYGEIWWTDIGDPVGHEQGFVRPALVVSSDRWNEHAPVVVVVPLTTSVGGGPTRVELESSRLSGLGTTSYARCEDIRSVSTSRLQRRLGRAGFEEIHTVRRTLQLLLEL